MIDEKGYFSNNTTYFIVSGDWYLVGVLNSKYALEYMKGTSSVLGDENKGGRLRFFGQFLETLPIPNAPQAERKAVAKLAEQAQSLHTQRRKRVEKFLRDIGIEPAESTSRNPLEKPWSLTVEEFTRQMGRDSLAVFKSVREETLSVTEEIVKVEGEIDERVKSLYGV